MGFKLPGKSIHSGTSAHRSALKMKMESDAAAKMKKEAAAKMKMEAAAKMKKASPAKKDDYSLAKKNDPDIDKYIIARRDGKVGSKGDASYGENQYKINKAYYGEETANRLHEKYKKKYNITDAPKEDDPLTKEIKDVSDVKKPEGPKTQKETIKEEKQDVKDARKSGRDSVKDAKKEKRINILKEKKDVADAKGRTRRSKRLERRIERKETGMTRREQRQRDKEQENSSPATMKKESMAKMKKAPSKFNAKLKAASAAGKLSGEFKEAVDASPNKIKGFTKTLKDKKYMTKTLTDKKVPSKEKARAK